MMIRPSKSRSAQDVALHYDELDSVYREVWGDHVHHGLWRHGKETVEQATEALTALVAEKLRITDGAALCDIGCGYGASAHYMAEHFGARVTGFSLSQAQVEIARGRKPTGGSLEITRGDWLRNDLPAEAFDGAYAIESSEHMEDKQGFFREAARVLRPGRRLVVCAWLADEAPSAWAVRHLLEPICREGRLPSMGSRSDYEALARSAGFEAEGYEEISAQVRRTWSIVAARLARKFAGEAAFRRMVIDRQVANRDFLLSVPRLMLALRTGAMRYGVFTWRKREG